MDKYGFTESDYVDYTEYFLTTPLEEWSRESLDAWIEEMYF